MDRAHLDSFGRDDDGAILVFWAVGLAVFLGVVALSFDTGRIFSTQSELQSFADHVALAAAGELDGADDAITRAQAAAANQSPTARPTALAATRLRGREATRWNSSRPCRPPIRRP